MIRVINIYTAKRALLRGHAKAILDMRFCASNEDILASVASDGRLLVWRLSEETDAAPDSGEESGIGYNPNHGLFVLQEAKTEKKIWWPFFS